MTEAADPAPTGPACAAPGAARLMARGLRFAHPGVVLFDGLDLDLRPGLNWLRGGDGRGKTTLLQLLAGRLAPQAGRVTLAPGGDVSLETPADPAHDATVTRDWLAARAAAAPAWHAGLATDLATAFGLDPHLDKPLHMLSTGSRRKAGLVAAVAGGWAVTLLDTPWAALDTRSGAVLGEVLADAAGDTRRAWLVAEHGGAADRAALAGLPLAGFWDLGD
jgi:ABC-type transport system involved in cytochrome c biogenesis ATPase subunit